MKDEEADKDFTFAFVDDVVDDIDVVEEEENVPDCPCKVPSCEMERKAERSKP